MKLPYGQRQVLWSIRFPVSASTIYHTCSEVAGVRSKTRKTGSLACLALPTAWDFPWELSDVSTEKTTSISRVDWLTKPFEQVKNWYKFYVKENMKTNKKVNQNHQTPPDIFRCLSFERLESNSLTASSFSGLPSGDFIPQRRWLGG